MYPVGWVRSGYVIKHFSIRNIINRGKYREALQCFRFNYIQTEYSDQRFAFDENQVFQIFISFLFPVKYNKIFYLFFNLGKNANKVKIKCK